MRSELDQRNSSRPLVAGERRSWWRKRNRLDVRNGELLIILGVALALGVAAVFLTAFLGVR